MLENEREIRGYQRWKSCTQAKQIEYYQLLLFSDGKLQLLVEMFPGLQGQYLAKAAGWFLLAQFEFLWLTLGIVGLLQQINYNPIIYKKTHVKLGKMYQQKIKEIT